MGFGFSQIPPRDYFGRTLGSPLLITLYDNQYKRYVFLTITEFSKLITMSYVGGPTGAIIVDSTKTPPEIDIDTSMVPRKAQSEIITGHWTFNQP